MVDNITPLSGNQHINWLRRAIATLRYLPETELQNLRTAVGPVKSLRAIAGRGEVPLNKTAISGGRTRQDYQIIIPIFDGTNELVLTWLNKALTTDTAGYVDGEAATNREVAVVVGSNVYPFKFGGNSSGVVGAGAVDFQTDILNIPPVVPALYGVPPGFIKVRGQVDLGATWVNSVLYNGAGAIEPAGQEVCWNYVPGNSVNVINSTATMIQPTGGVTAKPFRPFIVLGNNTGPKRGVIHPGTSLDYGTGILGSTPFDYSQMGPGRIAANAQNKPHTSIARPGGAFLYLLNAMPFLSQFFKYHREMWLGGAGNDVGVGGQTAATILATINTILAAGKSAGLRTTVMGIIPRLSATTNYAATLAGQTVLTGFGPGQIAQQVTEALVSGGNIDIVADIVTPITDLATRKWKPISYSATFTATRGAGNGDIALSVLPLAFDFLIFEQGTASQDICGGFSVVQPNPTLAFTFLYGGTTFAHNNGAAINQVPCADLIHWTYNRQKVAGDALNTATAATPA